MSETKKQKIIEPDWEKMKEHWPSSIVARCKIADFTGGVLNTGHMANLSCAGEGPPEFYGISNKVFYEVDSLVLWMRDRFLEGRMRKVSPPPKRKSKNAVLFKKNKNP